MDSNGNHGQYSNTDTLPIFEGQENFNRPQGEFH